eukprot:c12046_g1_i1 orf=186-518(-)
MGFSMSLWPRDGAHVNSFLLKLAAWHLSSLLITLDILGRIRGLIKLLREYLGLEIWQRTSTVVWQHLSFFLQSPHGPPPLAAVHQLHPARVAQHIAEGGGLCRMEILVTF